MAVVTPDYLASVNAGFKRIYNESLAAQLKDFSRIAQVTDDETTDTINYDFTGFPPALSKWIDQRPESDLLFERITIHNERYANKMTVKRRVLETDKLNQVTPKIQLLAYRGRQHMEKFLIQRLEDGFDTVCYDGQFFFDTDHSWGDSGNQDNVTSDALADTSLWAAIEAMQLFKDDQGEPLGIEPDLLIVGPKQEKKARELLQSTEIVMRGTTDDVRGNANTLQDKLDLMVSSRITGNHWFVLATKLPVKPLLWQWGRKPQFRSVDDLNSDFVFNTDKFQYGVDAISGDGYGEPLLAYGSNAA